MKGDIPAQPNQSNAEAIQLFLDSMRENKGIAEVTEAVSEIVQQRLEQNLTDFSKVVNEANLDAVEIMISELHRIKEESQTVDGVLQRLKAAIAPDVERSKSEIVSYREAINNLERYGSILPSDADIAIANHKLKQNRAWSILWQSFIRLIIKQLQDKLKEKSN